MNSKALRFRIGLLLVCCVPSLSGCGGDPQDRATGRITLDGVPLVDATVSFIAETDGISPAFATTDENGEYWLVPSGDAPLAPGRYVVRITTYQPAIDVTDPPTPAVPERAPSKYNLATTLFAEVREESEAIDFALDSKGKIIQPVESR